MVMIQQWRDATGMTQDQLLWASIGVAVAVVLLYVLAKIPSWVARARGHRHTGGILLCSLVGLVIWPVWLIAFVWACLASPPPKRRTA
jgi:hypothetical protein